MSDPKQPGGGNNDEIVLSYKSIRMAVGVIGLALPFVLLIGNFIAGGGWLHSISHYYYSPLRGVFVGALWAIGIFLISYMGFTRVKREFIWDKRISIFAGLAAIGVALSPTAPAPMSADHVSANDCSLWQCGGQVTLASDIHFASAFLFFSLMAVFCFFVFTKSSAIRVEGRKKRRNQIYKACGSFIVLGILGIVAIKFTLWLMGAENSAFAAAPWMFCLETLATCAFAFAWLVKGEGIGRLNDREP